VAGNLQVVDVPVPVLADMVVGGSGGWRHGRLIYPASRPRQLPKGGKLLTHATA
jgi:hypothetical protein